MKRRHSHKNELAWKRPSRGAEILDQIWELRKQRCLTPGTEKPRVVYLDQKTYNELVEYLYQEKGCLAYYTTRDFLTEVFGMELVRTIGEERIDVR